MAALADASAQAQSYFQAAPDDAPRALHRVGDTLDQRLVRVARGAVVLQRLRQQRDAGIGDAQRLAAVGIAQPLQQAAGQQFDLQHVQGQPAKRHTLRRRRQWAADHSTAMEPQA